VLFEGNYSQNIDNDYTHGNSIDLTFFRNWLSGQRKSFTDASNARAIGLAYGSWWHSFVGNVLGRSGQMSGWVYEDPAMTGNNANWGNKTIWKLGYDPERWGMYADPKTLSTAIRHGNFDYLTNSVKWDSIISDHALPNSLYLSAKPAFFGSRVWPWVQPEGTSKLYSLPAKDRFDGNGSVIGRGETDPSAKNLRLSRSYDPFASIVILHYSIPQSSRTRIAVYNVNGRCIRVLYDGIQTAGTHSMIWSARQPGGQSPGAGVYFVKLESCGKSLAGKIVLYNCF
jgi:hypothetical protein